MTSLSELLPWQRRGTVGLESFGKDRVTRYEYMAVHGRQASRPAILGLVQVVVPSESGVQNPGKLVFDPLDGSLPVVPDSDWNKKRKEKLN